MNKKRQEYLAYLLRLWRENDGEEVQNVETAVWRASLEGPQARERRGFESLKDLFAFLERETRLSLSESERLGEEVTSVTDTESRGNETKA